MVIEMMIDCVVGRAIHSYVGRPLKSLEIVPDPIVSDTYGLRAAFADNIRPQEVEFLIAGVSLDKVTESDLEEVDFTRWPPHNRPHPTSFHVASEDDS